MLAVGPVETQPLPVAVQTAATSLYNTVSRKGARMSSVEFIEPIYDDFSDDELPPPVEWILDESTGERVARFTEEAGEAGVQLESEMATELEAELEALVLETELEREIDELIREGREAAFVSAHGWIMEGRPEAQGQEAAGVAYVDTAEMERLDSHFIVEQGAPPTASEIAGRHATSGMTTAHWNYTHQAMADAPVGCHNVSVSPQAQTLGYEADRMQAQWATETRPTTRSVRPPDSMGPGYSRGVADLDLEDEVDAYESLGARIVARCAQSRKSWAVPYSAKGSSSRKLRRSTEMRNSGVESDADDEFEEEFHPTATPTWYCVKDVAMEEAPVVPISSTSLAIPKSFSATAGTVRIPEREMRAMTLEVRTKASVPVPVELGVKIEALPPSPTEEALGVTWSSLEGPVTRGPERAARSGRGCLRRADRLPSRPEAAGRRKLSTRLRERASVVKSRVSKKVREVKTSVASLRARVRAAVVASAEGTVRGAAATARAEGSVPRAAEAHWERYVGQNAEEPTNSKQERIDWGDSGDEEAARKRVAWMIEYAVRATSPLLEHIRRTNPVRWNFLNRYHARNDRGEPVYDSPGVPTAAPARNQPIRVRAAVRAAGGAGRSASGAGHAPVRTVSRATTTSRSSTNPSRPAASSAAGVRRRPPPPPRGQTVREHKAKAAAKGGPSGQKPKRSLLSEEIFFGGMDFGTIR